MIYCLTCLWHNAIICSNNNNYNIGDLGTPGTHCCKCLVTRSVKECDNLAIFKLNTICPNMLRNTTGFSCHNICVPDVVKEFCLTMVNMTHNSYNWRSHYHRFRRVVIFSHCFLQLSTDKLNSRNQILQLT